MNINEMIFANDEKPLENLAPNGGYTAIFRKIGVVGDSLSSGEFESLDENGNKYLSERTEHDCIYGSKYFYGYDAKGNLLYLEEVDSDGETVRRDEFKYND